MPIRLSPVASSREHAMADAISVRSIDLDDLQAPTSPVALLDNFRVNGRALAMDETDGFAKVIAHAQTDRVLGVHILGAQASAMIAEAAAVMEFAGTAEDLGRTCHAHPTLPEAVKEAALGALKRAIHA